ncbi:two-component system response regulator [Paraeggerthella hongkongensis]|jgi:putative nucleotidyltransferase with HDIG domain|nr:two-component system response regulator [Paraeggerthella hongkongensis]
MRKRRSREVSEEYRIMVVDDEEGIIDTVVAMVNRSGYWCKGFTNPLEALEELEREHYDLLILDYFMQPIHGDEVVERIRKTDYELYILLLTGHKELAPPVSTLKSLAIQAYCEKSDRTDQLQLLVESGVKSISQMRTIKQFQEGLNSILGAVPKIYQLQPIGNILEEILRQILPLVNGEDAFILIDELPESFDPAAGTGSQERKSIFCGIGAYRGSVDSFTSLLDHDLMEAVGRARTDCALVHAPEGVVLPLCDEQKRSLGVIYARNVSSEYGIKLLEIYAHQAASSISNAFLHSLVNIKNEELHDTYAQLKQRYMDTVEVLRLAVDAKDEYTRGHSDRVAALAVEIGRAYGFDADALEELRVAGLFHDIGKIGTADDILLKTDTLDDAEYEEIKRHPMKGAMILSAVSMFESIVPVIRHHHERYDGRGYPDGIAGQDIELNARIIAVADAFDAMTSDRQYRAHLSFEDAVQQLRDGAGTQFDPSVVDCMLRLIETQPRILHIVRR